MGEGSRTSGARDAGGPVTTGVTPEPILSARHVSKAYGERVVTHALQGVDLVLDEGEFCALTGPSGSGKTTFLNLAGLLDRPTAGAISIAGSDTGSMIDAERTELRGSKLGFVFQFHHLLSAFTALENVMMPLLAREGRPAPWIREKAAALLDEVGLGDRAGHRATDLSGGQQQRVAVARALVVDPVLVLADEPTGNLDTEAGARVLDLLQAFNERSRAAFLIVTHEEAVAARCKRVVHMVDGRIESDRRKG